MTEVYSNLDRVHGYEMNTAHVHVGVSTAFDRLVDTTFVFDTRDACGSEAPCASWRELNDRTPRMCSQQCAICIGTTVTRAFEGGDRALVDLALKHGR